MAEVQTPTTQLPKKLLQLAQCQLTLVQMAVALSTLREVLVAELGNAQATLVQDDGGEAGDGGSEAGDSSSKAGDDSSEAGDDGEGGEAGEDEFFLLDSQSFVLKSTQK
jgi:hypothetical protein